MSKRHYILASSKSAVAFTKLLNSVLLKQISDDIESDGSGCFQISPSKSVKYLRNSPVKEKMQRSRKKSAEIDDVGEVNSKPAKLTKRKKKKSTSGVDPTAVKFKRMQKGKH